MTKNKITAEVHLISFHNNKNGKMLVFVKNCLASPCQYNILDSWERGKYKYYGRLRWGHFYVATEPLKPPIYQFKFKDKWKGKFDNPTEEMHHLEKAAKKIWKSEDKKRRRKNDRRI